MNKKLVISKQHMQEVAGRDSPGVGSYKYDFEKLSKSVLSKPNDSGGNATRDYSFPKASKFFEVSANL